MWEKLNTKLKAILEANTLINKVYDYEASELEGTPTATITASTNVNRYHSTTENRRRYAFDVRLYMDRPTGSTEEDNTETAMRELVDSVINGFDTAHRLSGLETQAGYLFLFMRAVPSRWGYAGRESEYRVAELELEIEFDVDVNVISS